MPKPRPARCPFCRLTICPHCRECGANLKDAGHDLGCGKGPHCRACGDTYRSSRGGPCLPCQLKGLIPVALTGGLYD